MIQSCMQFWWRLGVLKKYRCINNNSTITVLCLYQESSSRYHFSVHVSAPRQMLLTLEIYENTLLYLRNQCSLRFIIEFQNNDALSEKTDAQLNQRLINTEIVLSSENTITVLYGIES